MLTNEQEKSVMDLITRDGVSYEDIHDMENMLDTIDLASVKDEFMFDARHSINPLNVDDDTIRRWLDEDGYANLKLDIERIKSSIASYKLLRTMVGSIKDDRDQRALKLVWILKNVLAKKVRRRRTIEAYIRRTLEKTKTPTSVQSQGNR